MKTAGKVFLTLGILSFLGAVLGGSSVFGPCFFIALGAFLMYRANEKEEDQAKDVTNIKSIKNVTVGKPQTSKSHIQISNVSTEIVEKPLTFAYSGDTRSPIPMISVHSVGDFLYRRQS